MQRTKFISDLHFAHRNVCKWRPQFASVEEHDDFVFNSIMANVNKHDNLWVLGDVCFCKDAFVKYVVPIADKVNLSVVLGNHDGERVYAPTIFDYINAGIKVYGMTKYTSGDETFILSHCPVHPAELRGNKNAHGHVHTATIDDDRYINCCCEVVDFIPRTMNELLKKDIK